MSMNSRDRFKEIIRESCGGGASLATDLLHEEFVIIHRDKLPEASTTRTDGRTHIDVGANWGTWHVANEAAMKRQALEYVAAWLAAKEWNSKQAVLARKLEAEAYALYVASCEATNTKPASTWEEARELCYVERDFLAVARKARELHAPKGQVPF